MVRLRPGLGLLACAVLLLGCARPKPVPLFDGASGERPPCSSWSCAGCCGEGECRSGKDPLFCGSAGKPCAACPTGASCPQGSCVPSASCSGGVVKPLSARVLYGTACNASAVLARDDVFAGLDRSSEAELITIKGQTESSCIEVDFGAEVMVDALVVRAKSVDQACTTPCSVCTEGRALALFHGTVSGDYVLAGDDSPIDGAPADFTYPLARKVRYAVVCRLAFWQEKADVAVDSIHGTCH